MYVVQSVTNWIDWYFFDLTTQLHIIKQCIKRELKAQASVLNDLHVLLRRQ